MVQQTIDSKTREYGLGNPENSMPTCEKQLPVAMKKTALRDLHNDNRIIVPNSFGNSPFSKDRGPVIGATKVESGSKRSSPDCLLGPSCNQPPTSNAAIGHLVYVRRKLEGDIGKSSTSDGLNVGADSLCPRQGGHTEEITQQRPQIKEPKFSCFPAVAPLPRALTSSCTKPSIPLSLGKSGVRLVQPGSNHQPTASDPNGMKNLHSEERYHWLQMLLKKLDESDQEDYIQMLRSLSSVELSRHAVELEKRSIQLSLEEAKEVQRVAALNVLGRAMKNVKASSTYQD